MHTYSNYQHQLNYVSANRPHTKLILLLSISCYKQNKRKHQLQTFTC